MACGSVAFFAATGRFAILPLAAQPQRVSGEHERDRQSDNDEPVDVHHASSLSSVPESNTIMEMTSNVAPRTTADVVHGASENRSVMAPVKAATDRVWQ